MKPVRLPLVGGDFVYVVPSPNVCVVDLAVDCPGRSNVYVGVVRSADSAFYVALPAADVVALLWPDEPTASEVAATEVDPRVWRLIEALADACDNDVQNPWDKVDRALGFDPILSTYEETAATLRSLLPVRQ